MTLRQLTLTALVAGLFATSASASITYLFDQEISGGGEGESGATVNITGTITVANLGTVELSDINDYSLSFTSTNYAGPTVLTPSNSLAEIQGSLLEATSTELLFDIEAGGNGEFRILGTTPIVNDFVRFAISNDGSEGSQVFALHTPDFDGPPYPPQDAASFNPGDSGTYTLGVIPEPTTLALLGLGGVAMLRRTRGHA
jgi:hypothetical protein